MKNCFTRNQKIKMTNGQYKNIQDIEINDAVDTPIYRSNIVTGKKFNNYSDLLFTIKTKNGKTIKCAREQQFLTKVNPINNLIRKPESTENEQLEWVKAEDLRLNDIIFEPGKNELFDSMKEVHIESIETGFVQNLTTYGITVQLFDCLTCQDLVVKSN